MARCSEDHGNWQTESRKENILSKYYLAFKKIFMTFVMFKNLDSDLQRQEIFQACLKKVSGNSISLAQDFEHSFANKQHLLYS